MNTAQAVPVLAALAQASRLDLFRLLVQAGPQGLAAGTLSTALPVSPSALSFHLKEMLHAGLVTATPQGRFVIYRANYAVMNALLVFLTENCCQGADCDLGGMPPACGATATPEP